MKEDFIHFIWRFKRFDTSNLVTTDGEDIEIIDFGMYNTNAGPDFLNAKVKIGDIVWAGNIEMHLRASQWLEHGHHKNPAYDNVILHVVMEADATITRRNDNDKIPCLNVSPHIKENLLGKYQQILHNNYWIPCQHHFYTVGDMTKQAWWTRILIERLEHKTLAIEQTLIAQNYHWEAVFYAHLAKNFGIKINEQPFESLANSLPLTVIAKHKDSLLQLEALIFGQAGLLEGQTFEDAYPQALQKEYHFLKQKFTLQTVVKPTMWSYLRLRPASFPTVRLAQFAQWLYQSQHFFSKIIQIENFKEAYTLFDVSVEEYWRNHYQFDKAAAPSVKKLGKDMIHNILINTVIPFIFLYGKIKNEEQYKDKVISLLEEIPAEQNNIIKAWATLGETAQNAAKTQALLHQKKHYCTPQRCLECAIGNAILKT